MRTNILLIRVSLILGVISFIGLMLSALALADIYQNIEPNLRMEWSVVAISLPIVLLFIIFSSITILKIRGEK